jgi:penicillin amidase
LLVRLAPVLFAALAASSLGCSDDEPILPAGSTGSAKSLPEHDIELVQDHLGITHVYARTDEDAFFGEGYSMARDRLFEMELNRRQARGTQAEILGKGALKGDIGARAFHFAKLGEEDVERAKKEHPEDLALVEAWVAGVNKRIDEIESGEAPLPYGMRPSELDIQPEKWTAADTFAIAKTLAFGLSNTLDYDILSSAVLRIAPQTAKDIPLGLPAFDTVILQDKEVSPPPAPPGPSMAALGAPMTPPDRLKFEPVYPKLGSNNWAVDGAHSTNGMPLLAGDPHQALTNPSRLWPTHLSSAEAGGTFDVVGFAFVGTPGVQLGHNAHVGWTATTNFADVMDIWDVQPGATSVSLGGEQHDLVTRTEVIKVKGDADVSVDIQEVPGFGVILPDQMLPVPSAFLANNSILFNWIGFAATGEASAYIGIDRAKNVDEFDQAADLLDVGAVNFVAVDSKDITYHVHTHVPDRGDPKSHPMPWHILSGDDPQGFWTRGYLSDDKLPHLRSPKTGFVLTANNDPFGFMADGSPENDPYYYGAAYATGFRAHRIRELLLQKLSLGKMSRQDMEDIQRDTRQPMVDTIVPRLTEAMAAVGSTPDLAEFEGRADLASLAARLAKWDGQWRTTSSEAVIFFGLQWFAAKRVFEGPFTTPLFDGVASASQPYFLGQLRNVLEGRFPAAKKFLPDGPHKVLLAALDDTAKWLVARFGSIDAPYVWSDVHAAELRTSYGGELSVPRIKRDGGIDTINVSDCDFFGDGGSPEDAFVSHDGSVYRFVVGFTPDGRPTATIDFSQGTSGEPTSPHFEDQNDLWAKAGHTLLPFTRDEVEAEAEHRVTLPGAEH